MTPVYPAAQIRDIDRDAVEKHGVPSLVLMENAAIGALDVIIETGIELDDAHVVIVCGRGNNGGDGLALARHCAIHGAVVECWLLDDPASLSSDAAAQLAMLESLVPGAVSRWLGVPEPVAADLLVDAILGTGASGAPRGAYAEAIDWLNDCEGVRLALDLPSGLDAATGALSATTFHADVTATMAALKPGLLLGDGALAAGTVYIVHIGVPESSYPEADCWLLDATIAAANLPPVDRRRHKYDRGRVLVVAGSRGMTGAGVMAAEAAARAGAGLTVLALPEGAAPIAQSMAPEIMTRWLASDADGSFASGALESIADEIEGFAAVAVGPGLSRASGPAALVGELLRTVAATVVLDADGLAPFAGTPERLADRRGELVITPHHGEMARLLGCSSAEVGADPLSIARAAARSTNAIVVLKGAPTVIALPDARAWIASSGNPGMASGGTGDVLTGMIVSLVAQTRDAVGATLAAVHLHGLAADRAAEITTERALLASDIVAAIPAAYRSLEGEGA